MSARPSPDASGPDARKPGKGGWTRPPWEEGGRRSDAGPAPKRIQLREEDRADPQSQPRITPSPTARAAESRAAESRAADAAVQPPPPMPLKPGQAAAHAQQAAQPKPVDTLGLEHVEALRDNGPTGEAAVNVGEDPSLVALSPRHKFEAWLKVMVESGASDLILRAGGRPSTRVDGRIGFLPGRVPAAGGLLEVLEFIMGKDRMSHWRETGSVDAALQLDGLGRFRINAYKQMGEPAVVLRRVSSDAPELEKLELPTAELTRIALRKRGLVLVTGIAGSGKSTTLAGLIQFMNLNAERHVVTLEDPIEILFSEKRCVISQREIGIDCPTFHQGLRHALRQSPDVILIGEMRDPETVSAALDAAETGHLVLSTMHTVNAAQTLDRILGFYKAEQHKQIRTRLGDNLSAVLSQRLIPRSAGKGMVPAVELMVQTPRIRELLESGDTGEIARTIEQGATPGLISFNQSLRRLVQARLVELKDALAASDKPDELVLTLRGITSSSGRTPGQPGRSTGA